MYKITIPKTIHNIKQNNVDKFVDGLNLNQDITLLIDLANSRIERTDKVKNLPLVLLVELKFLYRVGKEKEGYVDNVYSHPKRKYWMWLDRGQTREELLKSSKRLSAFLNKFFTENKECKAKLKTLNGYFLHITKKMNKELQEF